MNFFSRVLNFLSSIKGIEFLRLKKKSFLFLFSFFLFNTEFIWALKIVDIDETAFLSRTDIEFEGQKKRSAPRHARVAVFNIDVQQFESLNYCMAPVERKGAPYKSSFKQEGVGFDISYQLEGVHLKTIIDPSININADLWIVCDKASVSGWDSGPEKIGLAIVAAQKGLEILDIPNDGARNNRVLIRKAGTAYKTQDLTVFLKQFESRRKKSGVNIEVTFRLDEENLSGNLKFLGEVEGCGTYTNYDKETGFVGELATDLTMTAFGFVKLPSKLNDGDNGFDGVYVPSSFHKDPTGPLTQLWLTEAKCNNELLEFYKIMNLIKSKLRSDMTLGRTSRHDDTSLKATAALVYRFIDTASDKISLLGQRILGDGGVHSKVELFNSDMYWQTEEKQVPSAVRRTRPQTVEETEKELGRILTPVKTVISEDDLIRMFLKVSGLGQKYTFTLNQ